MFWNKVTFKCSSDFAYIVEDIFFANGAISVSIFNKSGKDPIYEENIGETPLWKTVNISALFENDISIENIKYIFEGFSYTDLKIKKLYEQDWIKNFQDEIKPIRLGKRLLVLPSWEENKKNNDIVVKIDPGMAFGSGTHETTQLCLEYLNSKPPKNLTVLDYGCGSGILAITSVLLGAKEVFATDIDKQALISTKQNSIINDVSRKLKVLNINELPNNKFDILIANIFLNTLVDLRDKFFNLMHSKGRLILSGIMNNQMELTIRHYEKFFNIRNTHIKNDWCLLEFSKI